MIRCNDTSMQSSASALDSAVSSSGPTCSDRRIMGEKAKEICYMNRIPVELKLMILDYLSPKEILTVSRVSQAWRHVCRADLPFIPTMKELGLHQTVQPTILSHTNEKGTTFVTFTKKQKLLDASAQTTTNFISPTRLLLEDPSARYYNYYRHFRRNTCGICAESSGVVLHISQTKGEIRKCPVCHAKTTIPTYTSVTEILRFASDVARMGFLGMRISKTTARKLFCFRPVHLDNVPFETTPSPYESNNKRHLCIYQLHDLYRTAMRVHGGKLGMELAIWIRNERRRRRFHYYERRWRSVEERRKALLAALRSSNAPWWHRHVLNQNVSHMKQFRMGQVTPTPEALSAGCNLTTLCVIHGYLQQLGHLPNVDRVTPTHIAMFIETNMTKMSTHDASTLSDQMIMQRAWNETQTPSSCSHTKRKRPFVSASNGDATNTLYYHLWCCFIKQMYK